MQLERPISKFEAILLLLFFIPAISLPLAKQIIMEEPDNFAVEAHAPHPFPEFSLRRKNLNGFAEDFENYYGDHFGFRSLLLNGGNILRVRYLGMSPTPDVVVGKDGWFFYAGGGSLDRASEESSFTLAQLQHWQSFLEERQRWLNRRGIRYLFVIPRDKQTIYPEFLPSRFSHSTPGKMIDQLVRYLSAHSSVPVLDLRDSLLAAKARDQIYYSLDTHWNSVGAFAGYTRIMERLAEWFPELKPVDRSQFNLVTYITSDGDLARMAGIPSLTSRQFQLVPAQKLAGPKKMRAVLPGIAQSRTHAFATEITPPSSFPRAVMIGDSFSRGLQPYLSRNFSRISYFYHPPSYDAAFEKALGDYLITEHPDVFIDEMLERNIDGNVPEKRHVFDE